MSKRDRKAKKKLPLARRRVRKLDDRDLEQTGGGIAPAGTYVIKPKTDSVRLTIGGGGT